jgi:hypothetical protein
MAAATHHPLPHVEQPFADTVPGALRLVQGAMTALRQRFDHSGPDARERYLSEAGDHDDLARREQAWAEHERRVRSLPPVL